MIEFFNNIWNWIISNSNIISTFFTSGNFALIAGMIFTVFKNTKASNKNTLSIDSIKDTIKNNDELSETVDNVDVKVTQMSEVVNNLHLKVQELSNKVDTEQTVMIGKFSSLFEMFTIVYSTIRDENVRNAVNSVLIKAKYSDDVSKAQLEKQIDELKAKLSETISNIQDTVNDTVDEVKNNVTGSESVKEDKPLTRY